MHFFAPRWRTDAWDRVDQPIAVESLQDVRLAGIFQSHLRSRRRSVAVGCVDRATHHAARTARRLRTSKTVNSSLPEKSQRSGFASERPISGSQPTLHSRESLG